MKRRLLVGLAALLGAAVLVPGQASATSGLPGGIAIEAAIDSLERSFAADAATKTASTLARSAGTFVMARGVTGFNVYTLAASIAVEALLPALFVWATAADNDASPLVHPGNWRHKAGPFVATAVPMFFDGVVATRASGYTGSATGTVTLYAAFGPDTPVNYTTSATGTFAVGYEHWSGSAAYSGDEATDYHVDWEEAGVTPVPNGGPDDRYSNKWSNDQIREMVHELTSPPSNDDAGEALRDSIPDMFVPHTGEIPSGAPIYYEDEEGVLQPGEPSASDTGTLPGPTPTPSVSASPSPDPSASPSTDPSASPSPSPSASASADPDLPDYSAEPNFIVHFWEAVQTKFPFDFFTSFATYDDPDWEVEFLGYTFSLEPLHVWANLMIGVITMGICWGLVVSL